MNQQQEDNKFDNYDIGVNASHEDTKTILEGMLDKHSLTYLLSALSEVCGEKESHVLENWQDKNLARTWAHDAKMLDRTSNKVKN